MIVEAETDEEAIQVAKNWNSFLALNFWSLPDYNRQTGPLHWRQLNPPILRENVPTGFVSCNARIKGGDENPEDITEPFTELILNDPDFNGSWSR